MPRFYTCGPNEAIIVSGCCHSHPTIRPGGRVFVWPFFHRIQRLSLNTMTLNIESSKVYSEGGVPVTIKGAAQIKIQGKDLASLRAASEMFLDKTEEEIMDIAKATLDGHQRSTIASMKIEDIYMQRHKFSDSVQLSAQTDLIDMGLTLVSYTVQEISDDEGYLDALGQKSIVKVRSDARQEISKAKSFSTCKNLEVEQTKKEKDIVNEQAVALKRLQYEIEEARYLKEHFENLAKSERAGDLQVAEMNMKIAVEENAVMLMEKEKETALIIKKKELKALELKDQVHKKADFECSREIALAKAYELKARSEAEAEANRIKKLAEAKAKIITSQKNTDAEVLLKRAEAFEEFGNAAKLEMVLAILPRLTAEIAGPITECKKITSVSQDGSVGFSRITDEIMEVVGRVCDSVGNIGQSISQGGSNTNDDPGPSQRKSSTESTVSTVDRTLNTFRSKMSRP